MYGFLFDQTYINLIIMGFFLFLIMFLWRKITIIEGNYFILEKRVDMIKKTDRDSLISKNMEKADVVMNEIFKDSTSDKKNYCNNVSYCPPEAILKSQKNTPKDKDAQVFKDSEDIDMSSYMIDAVAAVAAVASKPEIVISQVDVADVADDASVVVESNNKIEIIECKEGDDVVINKNVEYGDGDNAPDVPSVVKVDMTTAVRDSDRDSENDIRDILYASSALGGAGGAGGGSGSGADTADNNIDNDAMSVSSDITFGTDQDKSITKKYKKMGIEKLREECVEKSLNSEGTKAILIGRILEYNKKA